MTWLVVNADDFGQARGVNAGILVAHRQGIVTSTTVIANGTAFDDAVGLARRQPSLGVGVHLNLVEGCPISAAERVRSLLARSGTFCSKLALVRRHLTGRLNLGELRLEVESQIDRVRQAGIEPTHVDSHKHIHAYPPFFATIAEAARRGGLRGIRLPYERPCWREWLACPRGAVRTTLVNTCAGLSRRALGGTGLSAPQAFGGTLRTGMISSAWLIGWLRSLTEPTAELMVHPGWCDDELRRTGTRLLASREAELRVLVDPQVAAAVAELGVRLISYRELTEQALRC